MHFFKLCKLRLLRSLAFSVFIGLVDHIVHIRTKRWMKISFPEKYPLHHKYFKIPLSMQMISNKIILTLSHLNNQRHIGPVSLTWVLRIC